MQNPYDEELRSVDVEIEDVRKKRERAVSDLVRISADLRYANTKRKRRKAIMKEISVLADRIHAYDTVVLQELLGKKYNLKTKRDMLEYVRCFKKVKK